MSEKPPATIELTEVASSTIVRIGYETSTGILYVKFRSGGWYAYKDVPAEEYAKLLEAESRGKHFHVNIRNAYLFARVEADENDLPIPPQTQE